MTWNPYQCEVEISLCEDDRTVLVEVFDIDGAVTQREQFTLPEGAPFLEHEWKDAYEQFIHQSKGLH